MRSKISTNYYIQFGVYIFLVLVFVAMVLFINNPDLSFSAARLCWSGMALGYLGFGIWYYMLPEMYHLELTADSMICKDYTREFSKTYYYRDIEKITKRTKTMRGKHASSHYETLEIFFHNGEVVLLSHNVFENYLSLKVFIYQRYQETKDNMFNGDVAKLD